MALSRKSAALTSTTPPLSANRQSRPLSNCENSSSSLNSPLHPLANQILPQNCTISMERSQTGRHGKRLALEFRSSTRAWERNDSPSGLCGHEGLGPADHTKHQS